jgi:hypothetical protein
MTTKTTGVEVLSVFVYETISVTEVVIVAIIFGRLVTHKSQWLAQEKRGISFEAFKTSLGTVADELSDEQIEYIRCAFDRIADIALDRWLEKRNTTCAVVKI